MHCALLSPLVWIIQSMNISLIIAGKAEWRRVQDAVTLLRLLASRGPIYSTLPRHIASHLQLSTYQPHHTHIHVSTHTSPPLHFLLFLLFFVPSPLFSFPTSSPFPLLSPIILFTCLCHCVICFFLVDCASLPYSPPPPFLLLLWMDRDFVLTTGNAVLPYWPTNRKKSQTEMNPACLFF